MGTTWSCRIVAPAAQDLRSLRLGIQSTLDVVVAQMSTWESDSDLSRFNRAAADTWHELPNELFRVLDYAMQVAADSGGACDITAGALVNLWGFGPSRLHCDDAFEPPAPNERAAAQAACGWQRLQLDRERRRARQRGGMYLDLSAIAKCFAVDEVARYLQGRGIENYLVEIGGELRGAGIKPDGLPWWVSLENPPDMSADPDSDVLIALHGLAVATSGDYRRSFERQGRRYSHSIDPRAGRPICNGLAAVTVIHSDCMTADALSTALTVMGLGDGAAYAESRGIAARFIVRGVAGYTEHLSESFSALLQ